MMALLLMIHLVRYWILKKEKMAQVVDIKMTTLTIGMIKTHLAKQVKITSGVGMKLKISLLNTQKYTV